MGRLTPKHDEPVKQAIYTAAANGLKVPTIGRQLAAGTLPGLDSPYPMSQSTVRYYWQKGMRLAAASQVTKLASGDPSHAIDHLARQLISEAELGIAELRKAKTRNPKQSREWADLLRVLSPLARPEPADPSGAGKTKPTKPTDPLTARLTTAPQPDKPSPTPLVEEPEEKTGEARTTTHDATNNKPNHGGVAAQTGVSVPGGGGVSRAWSPSSG